MKRRSVVCLSYAVSKGEMTGWELMMWNAPCLFCIRHRNLSDKTARLQGKMFCLTNSMEQVEVKSTLS